MTGTAASPLASSARYDNALSVADVRRVIFASSLGTVFEWYDFYLYGSLAAIIAKQFFSGLNDTSAFNFALLAFEAGFAVRPFGAIVSGRVRSEGHTSELQSRRDLVCRLLLENKKYFNTIKPDAITLPKLLFQGYFIIYNNYYESPCVTDPTEANTN